MTKKTEDLLLELTTALFENKALMLTGGSGVGKTFIAKLISDKLREITFSLQVPAKKGQVFKEFIPCHSGISYEDVVGGIVASSDHGKVIFDYQEQICIKMIKDALDDYHKGNDGRYILIIDDIQRNNISDLMGELIECVGKKTESKNIVKLNNEQVLEVPPNFYLIVTYNTVESSVNGLNKTLFRKFYTKEILGDINYITDKENSDGVKWFYDTKTLMFKFLDMQYKTSTYEQKKYALGHGFFLDKGIAYRIRYQVIPLLIQYIKEGILDKTVEHQLDEYRAECQTLVENKLNKSINNRIVGCKTAVDANKFTDEDDTSIPLENLIGRIKEQNLLSDLEIEKSILFERNVCFREQAVAGITYHATIVAGKLECEKMRRPSGDKRRRYDISRSIKVKGNDFYLTNGMQPFEYNGKKIWENADANIIGETTSPNTILFGIIKHYYKVIIDNLSQYVKQEPSDSEKQLLLKYVSEEWDKFLVDYKGIQSIKNHLPTDTEKQIRNKDKVANKAANDKLRKRIGKLSILWKNIGDYVELDSGEKIILEGVHKTMEENMYEVYLEAMDTLKVRQMILQGPPGTSKTFSAKEFLKHIEGDCNDEALRSLQVTDYKSKDFCSRLVNGGINPKIAWDIVQFHPSYGYEDFIRGIEVSTKASAINYETVNKVLGNMAALAEDNADVRFFLIIDEINRANLATVFGELIYGLEYRNDPVATPYVVNGNNKISLPDNLYIIGTMNTADKSIGGIDYAIRRRFLFFEQLPSVKVIQEFKADRGTSQVELNTKASKLFKAIEELFSDEFLSPEYRKEDVQIGHTYFLVDDEKQLEKRFEYQIIPILKEYYKDGILNVLSDDEESGFKGFLNCISGKINMTEKHELIKNIFAELIQ